MLTDLVEKNINIENMIYEIRGKQVMLDSDLAILYQCKNGTKDINKAVKRNMEKFPDDFYFQLTKTETNYLWFQIGTTNNMSRTLPHVFTEQGVAMLSSVLHTDVAIKVSINIMRVFIQMRKYVSNDLLQQQYINNLVLKHDEKIHLLEQSFSKLEEKEKVNSLFFEGQIYDAYSLLIDILNKGKKEIIIIDNYISKELLDILKNINKDIKIVSKTLDEVMIKKYKLQYSNITFIENKSFHDRFIIIDKQILYHSGASFKDLGKKCFAINLIENKDILNSIIKKI